MIDRSNEILFEVTENALFVANGGRPFFRKGVISICYSHLSEKRSDDVMDHFECGDEQLVEAIRRTELKTYREAPNRIRADFNDEQETFHDYGGRLVWELLQNAHDAMGEGNISDVLIGSKGLGFKSVLEITNEPEIHSGDYHFLFSARRTQKLLKKKKLHDDPPLLTFRIPHECKPTRKTQELLNEGYVTVIRLPFRDKQAQKMVMDRLHNLDALFLLLAQKLSCVRIRTRAGETVHEMKTRSAGLSNGDVKLSTWGPNGYSQSSLWRRWVRCCSSPTDNEQQLTVAICLPTSEQGYVVSHNTNIPFHVFFPTDETSGTRALIHASLDLEHNRKRVRKGQHDDSIREEFQKLFQDVLKDIPARTALETFGNVVSEDRDSPLIDLQRDIRDTLCQTPFVPVIGGDRVRPGDVQLWNDRLGLVLRDDAKEVQKACLLASELRDMAGVIESFGAQDIENEDYIRLLRYCRNESIKECFASWRVLIKGGLKRIPSEYSKNEDRADLLERLRKVPCWWTGKETARALNGNRPLLLVRPEDWPDWLLADSLHPRMRKVLERYDTRLNKENQSEILQIWKELISKRLLKEQKEFLHYALLPFIAEWDLGHWKSDGWRMLRQVLSWWSPSRTFDRTTPWIEKTESETERDQERRSLVENLYLLSDKGWLPAADCYAGEAWDGPPVFDRFFASIEDRGGVPPIQEPPQGSTLSATSSQGTTSGSRNRQEVVHQTLQPKTGSGGGVRPSSTPLETEWNTSGKGVSRPRPETGQAAENWLEKKLEQAFPNCVQRRVRDDENRESDFVVSSGSREFHIEVKHVANWPGLFYWSELECEKAQVIEKSNNEYIMAILSPNDDRGYKIRWIWHPLNELKRASREVQWTGNSNYESVDTDSWDVETWRPDEVPTKRHRFRIKLDDEVVKGFEEDTGNLGVMCRKIDSLNAEMGIES